MKANDRRKAKVAFLLTNLAIGWPIAFILEALVYYLAHRKAECSELQFMIHMTLTVLAVSIVASIFALRLVDSQVKTGLMPIDTYRRDQHLLIGFFPDAAAAQVIFSAVLTTVYYAFISGGAAVLLAHKDHIVGTIPGLVVCGVLSGLSVIRAAYYMMAARCAALEAKDRRLRRRNRRDKHDALMKQSTIAPETKKAEEPGEDEEDQKPKLNIPEFKVPKMTVTKAPEFKAPELGSSKTKRMPDVRKFDDEDEGGLPEEIADEKPTYSVSAKTGVLPDMSALGLDYEDFDDFEEIDPQADAHVVPLDKDDDL